MPQYLYDVRVIDRPCRDGGREIVVFAYKSSVELFHTAPVGYTPANKGEPDTFRPAFDKAVRKATMRLDAYYPGWRTAAA